MRLLWESGTIHAWLLAFINKFGNGIIGKGTGAHNYLQTESPKEEERISRSKRSWGRSTKSFPHSQDNPRMHANDEFEICKRQFSLCIEVTPRNVPNIFYNMTEMLNIT